MTFSRQNTFDCIKKLSNAECRVQHPKFGFQSLMCNPTNLLTKCGLEITIAFLSLLENKTGKAWRSLHFWSGERSIADMLYPYIYSGSQLDEAG